MMSKVAVFGAVALLGATAAAAGAMRGVRASASLSESSAAARPVALTIGLPAELRCGRLPASSLTVSLPHAMHVPHSMAPAVVRLGGRAVRSVRVRSSRLVLTPALPRGVTCDSIVRGVAHLKFTRAARLGNPLRAGSYRFTVEAKPTGEVWHGLLVVRR